MDFQEFEARVYQYAGDSLGWAEVSEQFYAEQGKVFKELPITEFISGASSDHYLFRDSIREAWTIAEGLQKTVGQMLVGSCVVEGRVRLGVYIDAAADRTD